MSTAVFRYRTKPGAADENQRLIEDVFTELAATAPPGLRYSAFRLADGVTFVHVIDGEGLPELPAFQEFLRAIGDRVTADPIRESATLVGSYAAASVTAGG